MLYIFFVLNQRSSNASILHHGERNGYFKSNFFNWSIRSRKRRYKKQQILLLLHYSGEGNQIERKSLWEIVTNAVCKCSRSWGILHTNSMLFWTNHNVSKPTLLCSSVFWNNYVNQGGIYLFKDTINSNTVKYYSRLIVLYFNIV